MLILETLMNDSELCMISLLLANTTLEPQLARCSCAAFNNTTGTSKDTRAIHCVSRSSLRRLMAKDTTAPSNRRTLPLDIAYANDVDFTSHSHAFVDQMIGEVSLVAANSSCASLVMDIVIDLVRLA